MYIVLDNIHWMIFNSLLAVIPVLAGWAIIHWKKWYSRLLFTGIWLVFLPNTVYILTDLQHLTRTFGKVDQSAGLLLIMEYFILELIGIVTFVLALYPLEKLLKGRKKKLHLSGKVWLVLFNFVIAFGAALGRFQRTNSWEVITNTERVIEDSVSTLTSNYVLLFIICFGIVSNLIYFFFRQSVQEVLDHQ
jgi:uncharacterized membrane protein